MMDSNSSRSKVFAWWLTGAVGLGFCGGLLAVWLFRIDFNFGEWATFAYWQEGSTTTSRSEVFRNIGLGTVAVLGLILAGFRVGQLIWQTKIADKQKALAERRQVTERFSRAVEHLGNEYTAVRLGGIYALWRLIDDILEQGGSTQEKDVLMVIDALTAFVRGYDKSGRRKSAKENDSESQTGKDEQSVLRYDIETIVQILGEEKASYRPIIASEKHKINLTRANLQFGVFGGIDISDTLAVQANMSNCNLIDVNFSSAIMKGVNLSDSTMFGANCENTDFIFGLLIGTKFCGAKLKDAGFEDADISGADFENAQGLTQEQISAAVCETGNPPKNLPDDIKVPTRAPQDVEHPFKFFQSLYDSG